VERQQSERALTALHATREEVEEVRAIGARELSFARAQWAEEARALRLSAARLRESSAAAAAAAAEAALRWERRHEQEEEAAMAARRAAAADAAAARRELADAEARCQQLASRLAMMERERELAKADAVASRRRAEALATGAAGRERRRAAAAAAAAAEEAGRRRTSPLRAERSTRGSDGSGFIGRRPVFISASASR